MGDGCALVAVHFSTNGLFLGQFGTLNIGFTGGGINSATHYALNGSLPTPFYSSVYAKTDETSDFIQSKSLCIDAIGVEQVRLGMRIARS